MMRTFLTAVFALAVGLLGGSPLAAQQFENVPQAKPEPSPAAPAGVKIGVINVQLAMTSTQEGKQASEELKARFNPRQAELDKLQREMRDLENQLRTQQRTLSEDAQAQLGRQIELKRKQITRLDQDLRDEVEEAQQEYINRIGGKMQTVIDRYAADQGLNVILNVFQGGPVIFATAAVDITDDIVRLYDQTHPVPAQTGAAQPPATKPAPRPNQPPK